MSDEKKLNQVSDSSNQTDTDTYMKILKNTDNQPEAAENNSADNTDKDNKYDDNGKHTPRAIKRKKGIIKKISGAFRNPRKRKYAIVITAAAVILISVLTISIAVLLRKDDNSGITDFLPETVSPDVNEISENNFIVNIEDYISPIDFDELWSTAQDSVAYLYIPGTTVSYPIMQHPTNNEFYLNHAPDKKYDEGGSVYIELSNSSDFTDPVTMIYGHNMNGNENREPQIFSFFQRCYSDSEYLSEHSDVYIYLPDKTYKYEICCAVPYSDRHVLYYHDFKVDGVTEEFIDELYSETGRYSCFADRDKPSGDNPLIVLSTCYMWGKSKRYLVLAELTEVISAGSADAAVIPPEFVTDAEN